MIHLKSREQISMMHNASQLVRQTLDYLKERVVPGVTTMQLDMLAERYIIEHGGIPAFKNYEGFPNTICASVNTAVVHGIPNDMPLADGDIVSIDVGVLLDGWFGDSAYTYAVGDVDPRHTALIVVTREALRRGIDQAVVGNTTGDIGYTIQTYVEACNFSIVREYSGHGIGRDLHEDPTVPNHGRPGHGTELLHGMVICIEPMVNEMTAPVMQARDGWTVLTRDGGYSAHFEHTVAILDDGPLVLSS